MFNNNLKNFSNFRMKNENIFYQINSVFKTF